MGEISETIRRLPARIGDDLRGVAYLEERSMPEPNTGCWLWLGAVDAKGYGRIAKKTFGEGKAHRYALVSVLGPLGKALALHRCDQPSCVNPSHIFAGSAQDNTDDAKKKGRLRGPNFKGSAVGTSKLAEEDVRRIRAAYVRGSKTAGAAALADAFGVSRDTVYRILQLRSWSHV